MFPNHNASTSKTLINQARNISHPYLQAQAQPTTLVIYYKSTLNNINDQETKQQKRQKKLN
ncbi:hypothetical protein CROQUDRAFT_655357 [Cronartium quercuum f. sp. fusiforme G11]|uniref:Uncharacterized protein n=1 Tax=Cronartium quercuum f. sp. fusiforme G11 TaxID=708437 RepID=A0A9P6NL67_9BASI|nr:hypothetical protein CROQUDRAFT_655357 [Cronartium quercuum f. sp. fusiforme G11]